MRRILYWKRLLIVVAAGLAFCGTVFAVHHFQLKSQSSLLKGRALKVAAEADTDPGKRKEAVALMQQYLKFQPRDEEAFVQYANMLFKQAKDDPSPTTLQRATLGVEEFLRAFPSHTAERQKLAELYIKTGQFSKLPNAKAHIEMLFSAPSGDYRTDVDVLEMAATCERGLGNNAAAIGYLEDAIKTGKAPVRVYLTVMELHYANKGDPKRNTHIDDHLRALRSGRFEKNLEARVAAARFEMILGNLGPARADLKEAFDNLGGADNADALLAVAELEIKTIKTAEQIKEQHEKAEKHLRKAFQLDKKNVPVGMMLAEVLFHLGKREEGIAVLKETADALTKTDSKNVMLIDQLIDLGEKEVSESLIQSRLATTESLKPFVPYFQGRLAVLKQDWLSALKLLEEAAPSLVRLPAYHKKAMVGLASCYSSMQNPDKQLEYCRQALRDDGAYPLAVIGEAEALVRMGKQDEALQKYRVIVYTFQMIGYRNELVRLELLAVLTQPGEAGLRNWKRFEDSLGKMDSWTPEIYILNAESLIARGRGAEAAKSLDGWLKDHPKDPGAPSVWVALSRVQDGGKSETATAVLNEAQKQLGDTVEFRLAHAGMLAARAKPPTPEEFEVLAAGADKFTKTQQFRLYFGLGQAVARVTDRGSNNDPTRALRATAIKFLRAAADRSTRDLTCRAYLLDQALSAERMDLVEQVLGEMAEIEGPNGPVGALSRIAIRLPEVRKLSDPAARAAGVRELRALAERIRSLRPGWSRVYIAIATLDETEGLNDAALANYIEAIDKGDRQEFVVRRAIELYRIKQQDDKAVGMLNKLSTEVRLPDDLERYRSIYKMLATDIPKDSRPTIDRIAPKSSKEYRIQLLRGALLAAIREDADALEAFREAVAIADKVPETWASLVAQLMKYGKVDDAKRAVNEAKMKLRPTSSTPPEARGELNLALGGLYEMVGDSQSAFEYYNAACDAAPLELNPARQRIMFFQRTGQSDKALAFLNKAKDSTAQDIARWARRYLAIIMLGNPDVYNQRKSALALIEQNLAAAPNDPEDLKARAMILTVDPVTREEGIRTLRQFGDRGDLTPDEWYLLGQLAFDQGKFAEAERYFKMAARIRPGVTAMHLAAVVRVYLALGRVDLAESALERLKTNNPTSWEAIREEARVLSRKSKEKASIGELDDSKKLLAQAHNVIVSYPGWNTPANIVAKSGPLFEEVGLTADAQAAYQKFLDEDKSPGAHFYLARFYIIQKQSEKAIRLAQDHKKTAPVLLTARLLTGAVRAKRPSEKSEAEIEKWLDDALRDAVGKPELEAALIGTKAELLDAQGKYDEAIKEYERSMTKGKSELVVNNLCMLLALKYPARADEAVKMMTDLIEIRGPVPSFLDTRAVAFLVSSRPEKAKPDLEMALVQYDRPAYRFHLAWALDLDGKETVRVFAVDELRKAKQLGLTADDLHPIEYARYIELLKKYKLPIDEK